MAFSLDMYSCAVRSIESYAEAVAFYESCTKPNKGSGLADERKIRGKETSKPRTMGVRMEGGAVRFRYHYTDVVIWRPGDECEINPYPSRSTGVFATCFLPGILHGDEAQYYTQGDTTYPVSTRTTITEGKVSTDAIFTRKVINRKRANAALKATRYAEYRDWYNVVAPTMRNTAASMYVVWTMPTSEVLHCLDDRERWADMMSKGLTPDKVRLHIYHVSYLHPTNGGVWDTKTADTLPARGNHGKWDITRRA